MKPPRPRFIPPGAVKVADKLSDAVAYAYTNMRGRPAAVVYFGAQSKPVAHYSFRDPVAREAEVRRLFESRRAAAAARSKSRVERTAVNKLVVGDILNTSWGYDQTNVEFFEVVQVAGKHVVVREIARASESTGHDKGRCVPQSGAYISEPARRLVQWGDSVRIDQCRTAHKWNTQEIAGVKIGRPVNWTAYH